MKITTRRVQLALMLTTVLLLLSGCSTIIHGMQDQIMINAAEPDTIITVDGVAVGKNSVIVEVARGTTHIIKASKFGCTDQITTTTRRFEPATLVGIFLILPVPIDLMTGAAWRTYPQTYSVSPHCMDSVVLH